VFVKPAKAGPGVLAVRPLSLSGGADDGAGAHVRVQRAPSKASRTRIEAFARDQKAQLWIEHDTATHATLSKALAYVE